MATQTINAANLESTIKDNPIVILDFWAEWCGPCKRFGPTFEAASEAHADIVFGKIDTEAEQQLAGALQIQSIPTLMVFREGILLYRDAGALPPPALEDLIKQVRSLDMEQVKAEVAKQSHDHDHAGHDHSGHDHD